MKINGFKQINLKKPKQFRKILLNDKISYHPKNNSRINALVVERKDITPSAVYRCKGPEGQEAINMDICLVDRDEKTNKDRIKTMLYQEIYKDAQETEGHYMYLDKLLMEREM